jgi:DNA topoisomerase-1
MPATEKKSLIIVESPTKARTLTRLLGGEYKVMSSHGHVRDLPVKTLSVDVDNGYEPEFVTIPAKKKILKELKDAAKDAGEILLATDPDREGEAIAWHLQEEIRSRARRVEFHEFTRKAVLAALAKPHEINQERVNAQMGRRVLDRLVGYKLSPVLWRKVRRGLSAGRVQSVAVRLICEREEEIRAFNAQEYWSLEGEFAHAGASFKAQLVELEGKRISTPTQEQSAATRIVTSEAEAQFIKDALAKLPYAIDSVQEKQTTKSPSAPFITATMQQEAFKKLGFNGKRTMRTAQELYEGIDVGEGPEGLITYMRTDSTRIAPEFLQAARAHIEQAFGKDYLPDSPRFYGSRKSAQEAHEAIRPTNLAYTPERVAKHLNADQQKLYTIIYNRFLASQMANAKFLQRQTDVLSQDPQNIARFRRTDTSVVFEGFLRAYRDETEENGENGNGNGKASLQLTAGTPVDMLDLLALQHFTKPPARYTEASLIKTLEENGIGRPSTYAPIIETIIARGYIVREGRALAPTEWAFLVTKLLVDFFTEIVDVGFTAKMEEQLDEVEEGKAEWRTLVDSLYKAMLIDIERALANKEKDYKPPAIDTGRICPECGAPLLERKGQYGSFVACSGYPKCKYKENGEKAGGDVKELAETCPKCGQAHLVARRNRWGTEFVACSRYPKCDFSREPQTKCPKCGGELKRLKAKNRRVFFACEHNPGPEADGKQRGQCDFILWARPTVDICECGWFIAERTSKGTTVRFCSNPACRHHKAHEE